MMVWALTGPISKSLSRSSLLAVLMFTFWPGASLAAVSCPFSVAAGLAGGAGDAAGAGATWAGLALGVADFSWLRPRKSLPLDPLKAWTI